MTAFVVQRRPQQAQYFTEDLGEGIELDMILIRAGSFLMGSPEAEPERNEWEGPQHRVVVPAFFLGRYPVTQAQWLRVSQLPQLRVRLDPNPSRFTGKRHPVEQVSWEEAVEFCQRLENETQRAYRLPSEAEWEYACRAGTTTPFHWGNTMTTEIANYDGSYTYGDGPQGEYRKKTTPVDYFSSANAWGLSDLHGNVYEWCQDHWHSNYEGAPADGSAWVNENDNRSQRVVRGGSWGYGPRDCRSAARFRLDPDDRYDPFGFRVALSAPRLS